MNSNFHHPTIQARKLHFLLHPVPPPTFPISTPTPFSISRVPQAPIHPSQYILTQACSMSKSSIRDALSRRLLRSGQPWQNSRLQGFYFYPPPLCSNQFWSSTKSPPSRCLRLFLCGWAGSSIKLTQFPVVLGEHLYNMPLILLYTVVLRDRGNLKLLCFSFTVIFETVQGCTVQILKFSKKIKMLNGWKCIKL
jgi:hypothetical protein